MTGRKKSGSKAKKYPGNLGLWNEIEELVLDPTLMEQVLTGHHRRRRHRRHRLPLVYCDCLSKITSVKIGMRKDKWKPLGSDTRWYQKHNEFYDCDGSGYLFTLNIITKQKRLRKQKINSPSINK